MRSGVACAVVLVAAAVGCAAWAGGTRTAANAPTTQDFVSRPDLRPPPVHVITPAHGTAPGYVFIAPKKEVDQAGPMILDDRGDVVWFHPLDTHGVTDFRVQRYRGRPVLTWWRGETKKGVGNGRYVVADERYHVIANVRAGHNLSGDIHEFKITPRNTALFTVYRRVETDLSSIGGPPDGSVMEGVVQEVAIPSGRVLFEWHSFPQIGVDESYESLPEDENEPYDYFHLNAIEEDRDGTLLVSARHTHAIYKIRRSDGKVLWRLGGKQSDFEMGPGTAFAWQHDIRRQKDGTLTLFDNAAEHPNPKLHSKVLVLRVDERRRTATFVRSYAHPKKLLSTSQGNAQFLPDGHVFVGWGANEYFSEFDRQGRVLLDARFGGGGADSYRAYRFRWVGRPTDRPAVAVRPGKAAGRVVVYASWNGATAVRSWRVLIGEFGTPLRSAAEAPKDGFETAIRVASSAKRFAVQALDANGRVLRTSGTVSRG
jgi:hypothetical protein